MKIVVVGKGGREHALIKALLESSSKDLKANDKTPEIYAFPGSDAIFQLAKPVPANSLQELISWMSQQQIDLCVAGEESYLVKDEGLANLCAEANIPCWGPKKQPAQLEASKAFAKEFMFRHDIPTGSSVLTGSKQEALDAINNQYPTVLKFDGLAAGKGVMVCFTKEEAEEFLNEIFEEVRFGSGKVLVEEFLKGPEVSIFAAVSDDTYHILTPARDYKRLEDGDKGPNTGGMGAVASPNLISAELLAEIEKNIVAPTVDGLVKDGLLYRGFLYFGLMLTPNGAKIIEYNCRFGDPECQAVMPLIQGDWVEFCHQGAQGDLKPELLVKQDAWSVCLVSASHSYPRSSRNGDVITGFEAAQAAGAEVYHAGTKLNQNNEWETAGGRVLAVVAQGTSRQEAVAQAYKAAEHINFDGRQYRTDIGTFNF